MSNDIQNMIDSLAAAKQAMEDNPVLEARVESLENELQRKVEYSNALEQAHISIQDSHSNAQARITELEANLEAARFRELATRQTLEKLVSGVSEAISEVAPAPIPESGPVVDEPTEVLDLAWHKPCEERNVPEPLPEGKYEPPLDEVERAIGTEWQKPIIEEHNPCPNEVDPTQDSELDQGPKPAADTPRKPYFGRHYSMKPEDMSWVSWTDLGGNRPWWLTQAELDKLRAGSAMAS